MPDTRWSRRAVLLAGCGAGLAAAACGGPKRPTIEGAEQRSSGEPDVQAFKQILGRRAEAVRKKDERAFLADLDQSNEDLVEQQKMIFANLRQLPLRTFRYLTDNATPATKDSDGVYRFDPVLQVTQLTADAGPGGVAPAETFQFGLVKKDAKVLVGEVVVSTRKNSGELGVSTASLLADAPWNVTPLTFVQAGNVLLAGDHTVSDLDQYARAAETELGRVESLWGNRLRFPGHVMFLSKDRGTINRWYSGSSSPSGVNFEGYQLPLSGVRENGRAYNDQYAAARIVIDLKSTLAGDVPALVMRHELAHAVTARASVVQLAGFGLAFDAPRWALEGFARWTETLDNPHRTSLVRSTVAGGVAAGRFTGKPPSSGKFYGKDIGFNYALGATVFDFVDRRKGRDAAVEFYARVIKHIDGDDLTGTPAFDGICKDVMGSGSGAFLHDWAGFVRGGA
jgi:hypothetical protein